MEPDVVGILEGSVEIPVGEATLELVPDEAAQEIVEVSAHVILDQATSSDAQELAGEVPEPPWRAPQRSEPELEQPARRPTGTSDPSRGWTPKREFGLPITLQPSEDEVGSAADIDPEDEAIDEESSMERDSRGQLWLTPGSEDSTDLELSGAMRRKKAAVRGGRPAAEVPSLEGLAARAKRARPDQSSFDAPALVDLPQVPDVIEAVPSPGGDPVSRVIYWVRTRKLVAGQRETLKTLGSSLARLKREESRCIASIGRAARVHGLIPDELRALADAAGQLESSAYQRRQRADQRHEEKREATRSYETVLRKGHAQLAQLEERHTPVETHLRAVTQRLSGCLATIEELEAMERERRALAEREPTDEELEGEIKMVRDRIVVTRKSREEAVAARARALAECTAALAAARKSRVELEAEVEDARKALTVVESKIQVVRGTLNRAEERLATAQSQARVAEKSSKREAEHVEMSAAELDEEVGLVILNTPEPDPAFARLIQAVLKCKKRVVMFDQLLKLQQERLDLYDDQAAQSGRRTLLGTIGGLVIVAFLGIVVLRIVCA
jgi:hypothetical protein